MIIELPIIYGNNRTAYRCHDPEVILAGPADTGKTIALLTKLHWLAHSYDDASLVIARKQLTDTYSTVLVTFQKKVVPVCNGKQIAVIGMKALAGGRLPKVLGISAETCRQFALSLPIASLVCGIQSRENLRQDLAMARRFKPISEQEMKDLIANAEKPGSDGKLEPWKTTDYGGQHHREQHKGVS